jgi:hypothetical protein
VAIAVAKARETSIVMDRKIANQPLPHNLIRSNGSA